MTANQSFVREQQDQVLLDSIGGQRQVMLTASGPTGWRLLKGVFASGSPASGELAVRLLDALGDSAALGPKPGERLGATFRIGHKKCMFSSTLQRVWTGNAETQMVLAWPEQTQQLQRRAYERVSPPGDTVVAVRFWCENEDSDAATRVVRHGQLEDLSCGGIRLKAPNPDDLVMGATYKCVFTPRPGKPALVLDGILRHREDVDCGRASLGFQFVGLETSAERLRMLDRLARLVRHFQRGHSKFSRPRSYAGSDRS